MSLNLIKSEFKSLKGDHPIYGNIKYRVYGPYMRDDLRRHIIVYDGIKTRTISYPKFIMECKLKRLLDNNEEVHHKNRNKSDDRIDNYELMNSAVHRVKHSYYQPREFTCPVCNIKFTLTGKQISRRIAEKNRGKCKTGPFCSRRCSGKVNH